MLKSTVIQHYGSASALAKALGISPAAVSEWGDLVPEGRAYQIQVLTAGLLHVDPGAYGKRADKQD